MATDVHVHVLCFVVLFAVGSERQEKGKNNEVSKEQVSAVGAVAGGTKRPGQFGSDKQPDPKRKRT